MEGRYHPPRRFSFKCETLPVTPNKILGNVPGMKHAAEVPTLNAGELTEAAFKAEYVAHSRPCVIKGAVSHWAALKKWRDKAYLKRLSGQRGTFIYESEYHITLKRIKHYEKPTSFAEALERLHASDVSRAIVPTDMFPELSPDLGGVPFLGSTEPAFWYPRTRLFFFRNAGTAWHYHPFDETLTCQVVGVKKIGLVDMKPPFNIDLRDIFFAEGYYDDPKAFAALEHANIRWLSATLEEGDALYLPPLWWHGVSPVTASFGVTAALTWRSPPHVIAHAITEMARGEVDMIGKTVARNFPALVEVARKMGLEYALKIAWEHGA